MIYIYILLDPRDNSIRYLGKTDNPKRRMKEHLYRRYKKSHVSRWIGQLFDLGTQPVIEIIDTCTPNEEEELERFWISSLSIIGCNLTNMTPGGDGGRGFKMSEEQREKIRQSLLGRNHSQETKEKISLAHKGKKMSESHKKNLKEKMEKIVYTEKYRKSMQESMFRKNRGIYIDKNGNTKFYGVNKIRNKWRAYITLNGKQMNLGIFDSFEEACEARKEGEKDFWKT